MSEGGFTRVNLREDVPDVAGQAGVKGLAAHFAAEALGTQESGLSYQRIEPGQRQPWGHRHKTQEEIYVIVAGGGKAKLGDEEIEVGPLDAIRVAPELARNFEAGPEGLDLLAFGAPRPPDQQPGGDAEMLPGWWGDEDF